MSRAPIVDGDYAVVTLDSLSGVDQAIHQDEVVLHVGDPDTMTGFSEALRGMSPDEEKEFEVTYPEDFGQERLAGKTVRFRAKLTTIRTKELPELNDEFAQDLGDYQTLERSARSRAQSRSFTSANTPRSRKRKTS